MRMRPEALTDPSCSPAEPSRMAAKRARAVLRTPAEAPEANLEQQRALASKAEERRRQHQAEMEATIHSLLFSFFLLVNQ